MNRLTINPDKLLAIHPAYAVRAEAPKPRKKTVAQTGNGDRFAVVPLIDEIGVVPIGDGQYVDTEFEFTRAIQAAASDERVREICIYVDSPGGNAMASGRLGDLVAEVNQVKPVHAYIAGLGCSGAYEAVCRCRTITADRHAIVGSIGTILQVVDDSKLLEELGIKVITIETGRFKGIGASGRKIDEADIEELRRVVHSLNAPFLADVARGRRLSVARVKQDIATGAVWVGHEALSLGLIDRVATSREFFAGMRQRIAPEQFTDLRGEAAWEKFAAIACERAKVDFIEDVPRAKLRSLEKEFPSLAQQHRDFEAEYERRRLAKMY